MVRNKDIWIDNIHIDRQMESIDDKLYEYMYKLD